MSPIIDFNFDNGAITSGSTCAFLLSPTVAIVGPYAKPPSANFGADKLFLTKVPKATSAIPPAIAMAGFKDLRAVLIPNAAIPTCIANLPKLITASATGRKKDFTSKPAPLNALPNCSPKPTAKSFNAPSIIFFKPVFKSSNPFFSNSIFSSVTCIAFPAAV